MTLRAGQFQCTKALIKNRQLQFKLTVIQENVMKHISVAFSTKAAHVMESWDEGKIIEIRILLTRKSNQKISAKATYPLCKFSLWWRYCFQWPPEPSSKTIVGLHLSPGTSRRQLRQTPSNGGTNLFNRHCHDMNRNVDQVGRDWYLTWIWCTRR